VLHAFDPLRFYRAGRVRTMAAREQVHYPLKKPSMAFSETENEKRGFRFPACLNRLRD
jgi:hypothetical protein